MGSWWVGSFWVGFLGCDGFIILEYGVGGNGDFVEKDNFMWHSGGNILRWSR